MEKKILLSGFKENCTIFSIVMKTNIFMYQFVKHKQFIYLISLRKDKKAVLHFKNMK